MLAQYSGDCARAPAQIAEGRSARSTTLCPWPAIENFDHHVYHEKCAVCYAKFKKEMQARFDAEWDFHAEQARGSRTLLTVLDGWMEEMDELREALIDIWEAKNKIMDLDPAVEYSKWLRSLFVLLDNLFTEWTRLEVGKRETDPGRAYNIQSTDSSEPPSEVSASSRSLSWSRQRRKRRAYLRDHRRDSLEQRRWMAAAQDDV
jgi:hypothetical protein